MINNSQLKYIKTVNDLDFYLYKPTPGHWFFENWEGFFEDKEKHSIRQKIRMLIEWMWGGYCIYYAGQRDSILGYVLVARGGRRITCSKASDVVLGPYYTLQALRGRGIMPAILYSALHELGVSYDNAYCYIKKDNYASLRAANKCNFEIIGQAEMKGILRKLYLTTNDACMFYIVRYKRE